MALQKQAHIAQLQRAQETQAAATANANTSATTTNAAVAPSAAATPTPALAATAATATAAATSLVPLASVAQRSQAVGAALQSRKEEELNRKDRTLAEFLPMMENYNPIVSVFLDVCCNMLRR